MENHRKIKRQKRMRTMGNVSIGVFGILYPFVIGAERIGGKVYEYISIATQYVGLTTADIASLTFAGFLFGHLLRLMSGNPTFALAVEPVLDALRQHAFQEEFTQLDPEHFHRATLFKYRAWKFLIWPFRSAINPRNGRFWGWNSGWLVPVSRSGHTTKQSGAVFLAPDDADFAEGIAGRIWSTRQLMSPISLKLDGDDDVEEYASDTNVCAKYVTKRLKKGRSLPKGLAGFPVFKSGVIWGVVVLDSRRSDAIKPSEQNFYAFGLAQSLLDKYISRYT